MIGMGKTRTFRERIASLAIWLSLVLLFPLTGVAQPFDLPSEQFSLDQGLADRLVTDVLLHSSGFLWIATPSGLNRFDGYNFVEYDDHQDQVPSLSEIDIERIFEDHQNRIAVLYRYNFFRFDLLDPSTNEITRIDLRPYTDVRGIARAIAPDRNGYVHVVSISDTATHVYRLDEELEERFTLPERNNIVSSEVELAPLLDGSYLINDEEKGMRWVDSSGHILKEFQTEDFENLETFPDQTDFLHEDNKGRVWLSFAQSGDIYRLDKRRKSWQRQTDYVSSSPARTVWEDHLGNLIFAFGESTVRPPEYDRLICLTHGGDILDQSYLLRESDGLFAMEARDFFKEVFMGSGNGLHIVQNNQSTITPLLQEAGAQESDKSKITGITAAQGRDLYITTQAGRWYRYDIPLRDMDTLTLRDNRTFRLPIACGGPVLEAHDGMIWSISCPQATRPVLTSYNPETKVARQYPYFHSFIDFAEDASGELWFICERVNNKGLIVQFDPTTERFVELFDDEGKNPLRESRPYCIEASGDSVLWIGTNRGIQRIQLNTNRTSRFTVSRNPETTNSYSVLTIQRVSDSLLWLGTNHGLVAFNPSGSILSAFSRKSGLSHDRIMAILPGNQGNLWISTYYGLSYYDRQQDLFRKFFREDGLTTNEFSPHAAWRASNGIYFFGSQNGINSFAPKDLLVRDTTPKVLLTRITQYNPGEGGQIVQSNSLNEIEELVISHRVTYFQLNFTLPVYDRPSKNQYIAWLENYDKTWVYLGTNPVVRYTKLPPGRYTLHIKGAPPNGIWSSESLVIPVLVKQVFYKTWWFILLVIALVAGIIYLYLQSRLEQRLKVERLRTKLSSDLHDEMSGLLSGIAMQTDVLQMRVEDGPAKDKLKRIGQVSRQAMSKMNDVIWSIDSRKDKMESLIEHMRDHADNILHPLEINYDLELIKIDPEVIIPFEIRQDLFFIFKEAINNVAKHAHATEVRILLENTGKEFRLKVVDNGQGARLNGNGIEHKGQGLTNLRMRAQRIQANLDIRGDQGFSIELKMKRFA